MKILWLLAFILVFASPVHAFTPLPLFTDKYDDDIQEGVRHFWPDFPFWKYWKAQLYQESRFDPNAISPVGARGLAQFMPATWNEVTRELGYGLVSPSVAKYAILGGAYYMAKQRKFWRAVDDPDRHHLAQASYNAGAGNIKKAYRLCPKLGDATAILVCLPFVTGARNARETQTYVTRIEAYWKKLEAIK